MFTTEKKRIKPGATGPSLALGPIKQQSACGPTRPGSSVRIYFLKKFNEAQIFQKKNASLAKPIIQQLWWLEKWGSLFFYPRSHFQLIFLSKTPRKHHRDLVKSIHVHQKANKPP
jgi:hypothetical protein